MQTAVGGITTKLFVGLLLTHELKLELNRSKKWKESITEAHSLIKTPMIVSHKQKEYFGIYVEQTITTKELRADILTYTNSFKTFLPETPIDHLKFVIFPQLFIS